ncbi:Protein sym1 [Linum perenne]
MLNFWKWFQHCLALHPVKTQILSSGLIWGAGDIAAQSINKYTAQKSLVFQDDQMPEKINWKRVATTSLFGFGFVGPVGHFWYEGLDRFMRSQMFRPDSLRFVSVKVVIDGFLFGPLDLLLFFAYMGIAAGKSVPQIRDDVKRDFLPAFMMEGGVWPLVQVVNFRFVPVKYQLLYVNLFCLLDSCFLSWLEQQHNAPWKTWLNSLLPFQGEKG